MVSRVKETQRVIVYIDGHNLYHGLLSAYGARYKWLDVQALSESLLQPDMLLTAVKYFTAIVQDTTHVKQVGARQRQELYLKALQTHCDKLEIHYGRFMSKSQKCGKCDEQYVSFEEKKTDVNIACRILNDAHLDHYDCCYVVSGDSDLVPPLEIVKRNHPGKRTIVACPPQRTGAMETEKLSGEFENSSFDVALDFRKHTYCPSLLSCCRRKPLHLDPVARFMAWGSS